MLEPLQGFWNAVIYVRPRYLAYRRKQKQQQKKQQLRQEREQQQQEEQHQEEQQQEQGQERTHSTSRIVALVKAMSVAANEEEDEGDIDPAEAVGIDE